jgi:hypothetical protein
MKILLYCAAISLVALSAATATQQPEDQDSCRFKISESTTKPTITGPEDIVAMTYVIEQPDSPIEILAMDFKDTFVSVSNERFSEQLRCTAKVRNRSDQSIRGFDIAAYVTATAGFGGAGIIAPGGRQNLAPGQETEITACGGNGNGGAPGNRARIVVFVSAVAMDGCSYMPSKRYPRRWLGAS